MNTKSLKSFAQKSGISPRENLRVKASANVEYIFKLKKTFVALFSLIKVAFTIIVCFKSRWVDIGSPKIWIIFSE